MDRKPKTWEQITNGSSTPTTRTLISQLTYNETGQLITKQLNSTDSVNFMQSISYTYNERGWLLQSTAPLFQEQLQYNAQAANKQYNGNIAYQLWGTSAAPNTNTFTYKYDKLNRLISGASIDHYAERGITYDPMGNIMTLSRVYNNTVIDSLNYTYNSTNQLQSVNDLSTNNGTVGYPTGSHVYTYDGNGNPKTDPTKGTGITIAYNLLNLPQTITGGKTITYTYDASGQKLRRVSPITGTTDYISGIQYDDNNTGTSTISFIQTEEGKAIPIGTTYNYEYYLTDHLGNSRIGFDTQTGVARQVQQDDYMPFGMEIMRYVSGSKNEYLYNKKELQEELQEEDYGARFYDPVIARWTTIDPMAEMGRRETPYGYAFDDPMHFTDPDGMWPDWGDVVSTVHDVTVGAVNAAFQDATGKDAPSPHSNSRAYNAGRVIGHLAAIVGGTSEGISGGEATVGGVAGAPETGGLSLVLSAGGVAMVAHASFTIKNALVNLTTGNGNDNSAGSGTPRNKSSGQLRKEWEKGTGEKWPKEPDNPNKNQSAHHKEPLADGGHDGYPNVEPKPQKEHIEHHKQNGDFSRWRQRRGNSN